MAEGAEKWDWMGMLKILGIVAVFVAVYHYGYLNILFPGRKDVDKDWAKQKDYADFQKAMQAYAAMGSGAAGSPTAGMPPPAPPLSIFLGSSGIH